MDPRNLLWVKGLGWGADFIRNSAVETDAGESDGHGKAGRRTLLLRDWAGTS